MNLGQFRVILLVSTVAAAMFVASPAIQYYMVFPQTTFFSELGLLGPQHTASNYPSVIGLGKNYTVFLDVGNQLGHSAYYMVQVKLLNQTQFNAGTRVPSVDNVTFFVADKQTWELPIVFSFDYVYTENVSQVNVRQITFNGAAFDAGACSLSRDSQRRGYFGYLVFELWIYNGTLGTFENHNRSVDLVLNLAV